MRLPLLKGCDAHESRAAPLRRRTTPRSLRKVYVKAARVVALAEFGLCGRALRCTVRPLGAVFDGQ